MDTWVLSQRQSGSVVAVITDPHLAPRLRMGRAIPPLPLRACRVLYGQSFTFTLQQIHSPLKPGNMRKGKGKIRGFPLHTIKLQRSRHTVLFFLTLDTRQRYAIKPRPLYPGICTNDIHELNTGCVSQPVWTFWRKEISLAPAANRTADRPVRNLVSKAAKLPHLPVPAETFHRCIL